MACNACCWLSSARASMKNPISVLVPSSQRFPTKRPIAAKLSPSSLTSPKWPSLICQMRAPSQSPSVGGWAKVHGHGTVHLQTSNQSPTTRQLGRAFGDHPGEGGQLLDRLRVLLGEHAAPL